MFHCEGFLIAASHCKALDDASAGDSDVELPPDVDDDRPSGLTSHCNCKLSCHAKFDEASVEVFRSEQLKDLTRRQQETFNKVKRFVDELPDKTSRIAWAIGGQKVCRPFWEHYHAVGHSVMDEWVKLAKNGHAALPEKGARLPRSKPKTDEVDVWFLQIYQGLAEPTPMERDDGGYQHVEELPDLANQHEVVNDINHPLYALSVGLGSDGHTVPKRYLNQSDVNSLWHAYETQHLDQAHVSRDTFRKAFQRNWKKFLLFKGGVRCNVCADFDESRKHCLTKLERQEIDAQKQRHLDRCDADRSVNVRGNRLSALESTYTPQHAGSSAIKILALPAHTTPYNVEVQTLKQHYKKFLLQNHPDKTSEGDEETVKFLTRAVPEFLRWRPAEDAEARERRERRSTGSADAYTSGATGGYAPRNGAGSGESSWERQPEGDAAASASSGDAGIFAPCSGAPHCGTWESRRGRLAEGKQMEYLFLYAAEAHCVPCLQFYAPRVNVHCKSCRKNARAWAEQRKDQVLPPELDAWLSSVGL